MAGSLVLVNEVTVTSGAVATITGIDSTYDVYVLQMNDVVADTDNKDLYIRFTVSGTADSSSNYDYTAKELRSDMAPTNRSGTNKNKLNTNISGGGTGTVISGDVKIAMSDSGRSKFVEGAYAHKSWFFIDQDSVLGHNTTSTSGTNILTRGNNAYLDYGSSNVPHRGGADRLENSVC